ncbi:hypothetical protein QYE76_065941 [Lolium multiflorum]|uniref:Stress-associated endoplasmic reticulum protein n=1 Tax=Lolium multiflorum TaxID=4521 RepID=A0AAD8W989_LOLMU|nr:hypothetical protein QYE76_065941 [Lolium multiflorum]
MDLLPAKQKVTGPSRAVHALDALHATAGPTAPEPGSNCVFLYKAPRLASNGNSPSIPSPKLSCPAAPDPSVAADELTGDARDASMTTSRRLADRKTAKFQKNITKRGSVPETTVKKGNDYPVGPIVLGFFIFVVIGSSLFQIIRTASSGGLA